MLRFAFAVMAISMTFWTTPSAQAEVKETKLTGEMVCAKCKLKMPGVKKCTNAIQVKEGGKTVTYLLEDKGSGEEYHEGLCGGDSKPNVVVSGTVIDKDGKKWIKSPKVKIN